MTLQTCLNVVDSKMHFGFLMCTMRWPAAAGSPKDWVGAVLHIYLQFHDDDIGIRVIMFHEYKSVLLTVDVGPCAAHGVVCPAACATVRALLLCAAVWRAVPLSYESKRCKNSLITCAYVSAAWNCAEIRARNEPGLRAMGVWAYALWGRQGDKCSWCS